MCHAGNIKCLNCQDKFKFLVYAVFPDYFLDCIFQGFSCEKKLFCAFCIKVLPRPCVIMNNWATFAYDFFLEYAEDIYPYATFQEARRPENGSNEQSFQTFVFRDPRLVAHSVPPRQEYRKVILLIFTFTRFLLKIFLKFTSMNF